MYLYGVFRRIEGSHYGALLCHNQRSTPALFHHSDKATAWRDTVANDNPDEEFVVYEFILDPNEVRWHGPVFD